MANIVSSFIGPLIGGGLGSGVVTFALNFWRSEKEFRRTKLEALYLAVHKYVETMTVINLQVRTGRWSDKDSEKATEQVDLIHLLIDLYFRPLLPAFEKFKAKQQAFVSEGRRFKTATEGNLNDEFLSLVDEGKELKRKVLDLAHQKRII